MGWFYDLKIAAKLIIGFVVVAVIAGIVGVVGLISINRIGGELDLMYADNVMGISASGSIAEYFQRIRFNGLKALLASDQATRNDSIQKMRDYSAEVEGLLHQRGGEIVYEEDRLIMANLVSKWDDYKSLVNELVRLLQLGLNAQAEALILGDMGPAGDLVREGTDAASQYNAKAAAERNVAADKIASTATLAMIIVIAVGMLLAIALGVFIARIISNPVKQMAEIANKLAVGDIDVDVDVATKDEIGVLAQAFRGMIANTQAQAHAAERIAEGDLTVEIEVKSAADLLGNKLLEIVEKNNEVMSNVVSSSEQVAAGAEQVSESSMNLSQGAAEQASSIEQLTASIEQISAQTKESADNAEQANKLAEAARTNAARGNEQMQDMLTAMEEINAASANISNIIKVIDEIAFQTNILALNAAVEAARAGQHGKGFAVVAEEVRNLAARSADAAKETTALIEGSIGKTEAGTKIAQETAQALNEIVEEIDKVADLVSAIAIASNEQASGVAQINQGVQQISQVVQSNSATAEESAAASEELSGQAALLKEMVGQFRLKQVSRSNNQLQELSPEVLKILEDMTKKKTSNKAAITAEARGGNSAKKPKIALSDQEFGKY